MRTATEIRRRWGVPYRRAPFRRHQSHTPWSKPPSSTASIRKPGSQTQFPASQIAKSQASTISCQGAGTHSGHTGRCGRPLRCKRFIGNGWACGQVRSCVRRAMIDHLIVSQPRSFAEWLGHGSCGVFWISSDERANQSFGDGHTKSESRCSKKTGS
jgi:hypothetical protein